MAHTGLVYLHLKLLLGASAFALIAVVLLGLNLVTQATKPDWQIIGDTTPDLFPPTFNRSYTLDRWGLMSLEEAEEIFSRLQFTVKIPEGDLLPSNFSIRGVLYFLPDFGPRAVPDPAPEPIAQSPERVILLLWDRPIPIGMTKQAFDREGGITFEILDFYKPCDETMDFRYGRADFLNEGEEPASDLFWGGYPTMYSDQYVETCYLDEDVIYRIFGRYRSGPLLGLMESLVRG